MRKKTETYHSLFGDRELHYPRRWGAPYKPDPALVGKILSDTHKQTKLRSNQIALVVVGDQKTDIDLGIAHPQSSAVILPITEKYDDVEQHIQNCNHPEHVTLVGDRKQLRDSLESKIDDLLEKYKFVVVGMDLDDTMHPKFDKAQEYAAQDVGVILQKLFEKRNAKFTKDHVEFLRRFNTYFKRGVDAKGYLKGERLQGADYKIALATVFLLNNGDPAGLRKEYLLGEARAETHSEKTHNVILRTYHGHEKKLLIDIEKVTHGVPDTEVVLHGKRKRITRRGLFDCQDEAQLVAQHFREQEAEHSVKLIEKGTIRLYSEMVSLVRYLRQCNNVGVRIITNKTENVLLAIYDCEFRII